MNVKRWISISLALAAAGGAVSVASGAVAPERGAQGDPPAVLATGPDHTAIGQARAHVGALDTPRSASDALAPRAAATRLIADGLVEPLSMRRVEAGGEAGWLGLTTDGDQVCVVSNGALTCPTVQLLVDEGVAPGYVGRATESVVHVFGVVSDDASGLQLLLRDRRTLNVTVRDNFFAVDVPAVPIELTWTGPSGPASWTFPARSGVGGVP